MGITKASVGQHIGAVVLGKQVKTKVQNVQNAPDRPAGVTEYISGQV